MDLGHCLVELVDEFVVLLHLLDVRETFGDWWDRVDLVQKFHILSTKSRLTEFRKLVCGGWIVYYNLKDLWAKEVGELAQRASTTDDTPLGDGHGIIAIDRWCTDDIVVLKLSVVSSSVRTIVTMGNATVHSTVNTTLHAIDGAMVGVPGPVNVSRSQCWLANW